MIRWALRRVYQMLIRSEPVQRVLRREVGAAWEARLRDDFVNGPHGAAYGLTPLARRRLVYGFERNVHAIPSGTSVAVHLVLAREILALPPELQGDVVECGVWKGSSTASLSLVCQSVGRRLLVCDSFQGLPDDGGQRHVAPHFGIYGYYKAGMFAGRLDEVEANVARFGAAEVCHYVPGFFSESLPALDSAIAFVFLDVDLVSSTRDCLRHLWPKLAEGGAVYSDDAGDLDVVRVFFDDNWWQSNLGCSAPGFVGSGCGLPLNPDHSPIGYIRKLSDFTPEQWQRAEHLYYPDK